MATIGHSHHQSLSTADERRRIPSQFQTPRMPLRFAVAAFARLIGRAAPAPAPATTGQPAPDLASPLGTMPLRVLVDLLEAANGPDPRLDQLIAIEVGNRAAPTPSYTAFLDAALTLIMPSRDYEVNIYGSGADGATYTCAAYRWWPVEDRRAWRAESGNKLSPALAMCIAAMKVRLARQEEHVPIAQLVERIKAATGPDRDLDRLIELEFKPLSRRPWDPPKYTGSVKAADTLLIRSELDAARDPFDTTENARRAVRNQIWRMRHAAGATADQFPHPALETCAAILMLRQAAQSSGAR